MKQMRLEGIKFSKVGPRPAPHERYFPHVYHAVCNDIASSAGDVSIDPRPYPVGALADVDRNIVEVAKGVDADLSGNRPSCLFAITNNRN